MKLRNKKLTYQLKIKLFNKNLMKVLMIIFIKWIIKLNMVSLINKNFKIKSKIIKTPLKNNKLKLMNNY